MNVISYSLFGFNKERQPDCFDFNSYLRGLMINVRLQRLLFPDWKIVLHVDSTTYSGFERFFQLLSLHEWGEIIKIVICEDAPLTKAMLWRMKPLFNEAVEYIICRDLDSPLTFRDAQAVKDWQLSGKAAHAITDSISHAIPMLGGMIGFERKHFKDYTGFTDWDTMINTYSGYATKGADQQFLNAIIYTKFASPNKESILQHYVLGMPNTFLSGYRSHIPDIDIGLPNELKESDNTCGHIGAAGYYPPPTEKFLLKYYDSFADIRKAEALHTPEIFNWKI